MHFSFIQFTLPNVSAQLILIPSQASLAHFIHLGILGPIHSYIPISSCYVFWASLAQLPYPLLSGAYWPLYQPHLLIPFFGLLRPIFAFFPFLIIPMGLLFPYLGSLEPVCFL